MDVSEEAAQYDIIYYLSKETEIEVTPATYFWRANMPCSRPIILRVLKASVYWALEQRQNF